MTPRDKAEELVEKMSFDFDMCRGQNIKCALIAVDEIINSSPSLPILSDNGSYGSDIEESTKWWQQVKNEIEKL